jgi:hypothetical protein
MIQSQPQGTGSSLGNAREIVQRPPQCNAVQVGVLGSQLRLLDDNRGAPYDPIGCRYLLLLVPIRLLLVAPAGPLFSFLYVRAGAHLGRAALWSLTGYPGARAHYPGAQAHYPGAQAHYPGAHAH